MGNLLLISTFLTSYLLCAVIGQSPCTTVSGQGGSCVPFYQCSKLVPDPSLSGLRNLTPAQRKLLQDSLCGMDGSTPKVCCPPNNGCTTPDGVPGNCVDIFSCPHIANMLKLNPPESILQYMQRSVCNGIHAYSVCCGPPPTVQHKLSGGSTQRGKNGNTGQNGQCQLSAFPPEASSNCCGIDTSASRIFGGTAAAVDEYPWLAVIEYHNVMTMRMNLLCGGALISGRYVLTAGHCLEGPVLSLGTPVNVRLGEYNITNSGVDCAEVDGGGELCNDGAEIVPIERAIAHPRYDPYSSLRRHDIGLIRLSVTVQYTDFIRPICLPTADFTSSQPSDLMLHTAGWGATDDRNSYSDIKMKVRLPYVTQQACQPSFSSRQMILWEGQICAGGVKGEDSCRGDSGGPLMMEKEFFYELVGVVSFGFSPCGQKIPGVYTKVVHYLPWITSQIVA